MYTIKPESELSALAKKDLLALLLLAQTEIASHSQPESEVVSQLETQLGEANAALHVAEKKAKELEQTVMELNTELSNAEKAAPKASRELTIGGKKFEMIAGTAKFNGNLITYEVLKSDKKLAEELVEIGAGFLIPIK
jgi:septal ring factor EnvC (AmiA/AmiB activator)